jgi:hypothetical protein
MTRIAHAWRALEREQRLAALTALGLFVSMFLPWYSKADTFVEHGAAKATQTSLSAFQAFSFVEAAVLLVSAGVLTMLFSRAEGRDFQLPGGDGLIVMIAGAWAALLIFYRLLDKPGLQASQRITATVGVEWGIFIALLLALGLLYAGQRMRAEERPEPPLMRRRGRPAPRDDPGGGEHPDRDRPWRETEETIAASRRTPRARPEAGAHSARPIPARPPSAAPSSEPAAQQDSPPRAPEPAPAAGRRSSTTRPRFPPAPPQQMSFEDPPTHSE